VLVYNYINCALPTCEACRKGRENHCPRLRRLGFEWQGAFAEYIAVPARQLMPIAQHVSFEQSSSPWTSPTSASSWPGSWAPTT
jgi:D-arabinose 1-dehydrogenase-like Zn-dependent alcohol dehydrogenase